MAKFVLMTVGFVKPSPEDMQKWMDWFKSIQDKIEEQVGFMNGKEVFKYGDVDDLQMDLDAITGLLKINARDIDEAVEIAKKCPMVTSTRVYELREG